MNKSSVLDASLEMNLELFLFQNTNYSNSK